MKNYIILIIVVFAFKISYSQKSKTTLDPQLILKENFISVNEFSSFIKQNFNSDSTKIMAIYLWITNNIMYDVDLIQSAADNVNKKPQDVEDVIKTHKAVCQGYSDLFASICKNVDINAMVVGGYTKKNGVIAPLSHAWVAAELYGEWFFFDPTWGAGYVNNGVFSKRCNPIFYKISPQNNITDHMPFDPIFQLLDYPINNNEFINNITTNNKTFFDFKDSINTYKQLSDKE